MNSGDMTGGDLLIIVGLLATLGLIRVSFAAEIVALRGRLRDRRGK